MDKGVNNAASNKIGEQGAWLEKGENTDGNSFDGVIDTPIYPSATSGFFQYSAITVPINRTMAAK